MELMLLDKIDNDMVLLTDKHGTKHWAHISALKVPTSYVGIVQVEWYGNLYSKQISTIIEPIISPVYLEV